MAFPPQGTASNIGDIATAVWAFANRRLTNIDLQPRIDLLGEDATFEAGVGARKSRLDATVSSRLASADFDARLSAVRAARIDDIFTFEQIGDATILANGAEQELVELVGLGLIEGWIDLTNMALGDTTTIREYIRLRNGAAYVLYAANTYNNAQAQPGVHPILLPARWGIRVTLQQTAGVNRNYDYGFFRWVPA